jgi:CubicO group peptidase (beta-lactamase class C family)
MPMSDLEAHQFRLGSAAGSIVGIATGLLEREGLDEEVKTHLRAIRDLALEMAREGDRTDPTRRP